MKHILITGKNSFVGESVTNWLAQWPGGYKVNSIDVKDLDWMEYDFSKYDVVFHVAGLAHKKITAETKPQYLEINTKLAVRVCEKAKLSGVKQFIFMSSISVFGSKVESITETTTPQPDDVYGLSKLKADKCLHRMAGEGFAVLSLRPPMIYGYRCKGNFVRLQRLAKYAFIFPNIKNQRSMIFIDNFSQCVKMAIDSQIEGVLHPQNKEYVCTTEMTKLMRAINNKNTFVTRLVNFIIIPLSRVRGPFRKMFSNLTYDEKMSGDFSYCVTDFEDSIRFSLPD